MRAFDPNFASGNVTHVFVDSMAAITPLVALGLLADMKQELPVYMTYADEAPIFDQSDVTKYSKDVLTWWCTHGKNFRTWARAAQIVFSLSPNSASCERVLSLLAIMFSDEQRNALADHIRASLMLKYHKRTVG